MLFCGRSSNLRLLADQPCSLVVDLLADQHGPDAEAH